MEGQIKDRKIRTEKENGILLAFSAYFLWGLLPIYWKALDPLNPMIIMYYRLVVSCIFCLVLALFLFKKEDILAPIKNKKNIIIYIFNGMLISANWYVYIWAVNSNHILETSLGYYINPLMSILLAMIFFKEKINKLVVIAILLAVIGVLVMVIGFGKVPVVALFLAVSFATYGALKKKLSANSIVSLFYETLFLAPFALVLLIYMERAGTGVIGNGTTLQYWLILLIGFATAMPLLLFAAAANRLSLMMIGFIQYLSPTMSLFIGIFMYGESFEPIKIISFTFVWAGIAVYIFSQIVASKSNQIPA